LWCIPPQGSEYLTLGLAFLVNLNMTKMKTHKASRKRFKVTASGKLKRSQAGKKHLNSPKPRKRKRQLRGGVVEAGRVADKYVRNIIG
jgi:large subunit ribosomal protein L35